MNIIRISLKLLVPVVIGFLTLEVGIRVIQKVILDNNAPQYTQYAEIFSDERDKDYLFWHKPNVNWKLTDGYYDFTFITNNLGHRSLSDEINFHKSIVFLGDSIIEGASVENDETISYLINEKTKIPTINLGVGSSSTVQEFLLAKEIILPEFNTTLLVLGFSLSDIEQNLYRRYFDPSIGNWKYYDSVYVNDDLTSHSFSNKINKREIKSGFTRKLKDFLRKSEALTLIYRITRSGLNIFPSIRSYHPEAWKNTEYFIKKIAGLATQHNAEFVVIIYPYEDQVEGRLDLHEQNMLIKILERHQIHYYDPFEVLFNNKKSTLNASNLYHDNVHPNKLGTYLIAEDFLKYLKSNEFIDK